jgi:small-conductance mechanosensitive channel
VGIRPPPLPAQAGLTARAEWLEPSSELLSDLAVFAAVTAAVYRFGRPAVVPNVLRVLRRRNSNNPTLATAMDTCLGTVFAAVGLLAGLAALGQAKFLVNTDSAILLAAVTFAFGVAGQGVLWSPVGGLFLVADPESNVGEYISWPAARGPLRRSTSASCASEPSAPRPSPYRTRSSR